MGSEMCIRDSYYCAPRHSRQVFLSARTRKKLLSSKTRTSRRGSVQGCESYLLGSPPGGARAAPIRIEAAADFRPQVLEIRAARRLARQSAKENARKKLLRTVAAKGKLGEPRLQEHGWEGLSDLYEPYLLQKEMSGNVPKGGILHYVGPRLYESSGGNQVDGLPPAPIGVGLLLETLGRRQARGSTSDS